MQEVTIKRIVEEILKNHPSLFLIDLEVKQNNQITVVLDGDKSVAVSDCIKISRKIEENFDRETEDFSLQVTSAGVTSPLKVPRQYIKNIGRKLEVQTSENHYKAEMVNADKDGIELRWKQREPKPVGKGKYTVQKKVELTYSEIEKAKVMITFN